jgi:hypothetical protein
LVRPDRSTKLAPSSPVGESRVRAARRAGHSNRTVRRGPRATGRFVNTGDQHGVCSRCKRSVRRHVRIGSCRSRNNSLVRARQRGSFARSWRTREDARSERTLGIVTTPGSARRQRPRGVTRCARWPADRPSAGR